MLYGESKRHIQLKIKANEFLQGIGCQNIQFEYRLDKIQYTLGARPRHWKTKQYFQFDVAGFKDGRLLVVECGGITAKKLKSMSTQGIMIYILPYGKNKPYLWQEGIDVCVSCGHKIS